MSIKITRYVQGKIIFVMMPLVEGQGVSEQRTGFLSSETALSRSATRNHTCLFIVN